MKENTYKPERNFIMTNITINAKNRTIEMNKTFSAAASKYGSPEYVELQNARHDYPNYRVVTIAKKAAKSDYKGLTFEYMKKYIALHDDEEKSIMKEFLNLRGESEEAKAIGAMSAAYSEIKDWFFEQYPAIQNFYKEREALLNDAVAKQAAKKAA